MQFLLRSKVKMKYSGAALPATEGCVLGLGNVGDCGMLAERGGERYIFENPIALIYCLLEETPSLYSYIQK